ALPARAPPAWEGGPAAAVVLRHVAGDAEVGLVPGLHKLGLRRMGRSPLPNRLLARPARVMTGGAQRPRAHTREHEPAARGYLPVYPKLMRPLGRVRIVAGRARHRGPLSP